MITEIGIAAGDIWHYLDQHKSSSLTQLVSGIDKNRKVVGKYVATGFIPKFIDELEQQGIKIPRGIFSVT